MSLENIAPSLSEDQQKEIAAKVFRDFESDDDSRKGWLDMHAGWLRLFNQMDRPLHEAWPGASTETIPLLAEACTQFHARAMTALFPGKKVVTAVPTLKNDPETTQRADRVGKHMSWQLMTKDPFYKADKDTLLAGLPLHGSFFTKTYYHPVLKRNVVENVRPTDLVIPYGIGLRPIDQVERKTQIIWQTPNEAKILLANQFYFQEPEEYAQGERTKTQEAADKAQGVTPPIKLGLCKILEQHCIADIDGDGISEPYIIWVCGQSKRLLRIAVRYETEMDPLMLEENPVDNKRAVEYFTHYYYMPNPEGFYGLGLGHLIGAINKAANKLLRQQIDAGTLANIGNMSGFISDMLGVRGGEIKLELGKFTKIPATADDIKKGVFQLQFPPPNQTNVQALGLLMGRSDRLAQVTELTSGQPDKVYQPTMAMALIEQAQQIGIAVHARVISCWGEELKKYYKLNSIHLQDVEAFSSPSADGTVQFDAVKRDDYANDLMIEPIADPKQNSKEQKLMKAQMEWEFLSQNPLVQQNPIAFYFASHRFLEAIETQNIDQVLPPPMPPREDDPYKENTAALMPQPMVPPAFPDQDHMTHIMAHKELTDGNKGTEGYTGQMKPEGMQALQDHIQQHIALMYEQEHGPGNVPQGVPGAMGPAQGMDLGGLLGGLVETQGTA